MPTFYAVKMPQPDNAPRRALFVDVLVVFSALAVVFLHANAIFWTRPQGRLWLTSNIIESVCYFAVPVFFMMTMRSAWSANSASACEESRIAVPCAASSARMR